jgi:hypothetical protein
MGSPSRAQLHYLKNLGYTGPAPVTSLEASVAIDALKAGGNSDAAYRAILNERREAIAEERRELEAMERENELQDLQVERDFQEDMAAIEREFGPSPRRGPTASLLGCVFSVIVAPFRAAWWTIKNVAYVASLVILAPFQLLGWTLGRGADLTARAAVASAKGTAAASRAGSEFARASAVPWIRARDWKGMATRTAAVTRALAQRAARLARAVIAAMDRTLQRFAGRDPTLLLILRVAAVAAFALGLAAAVTFLAR